MDLVKLQESITVIIQDRSIVGNINNLPCSVDTTSSRYMMRFSKKFKGKINSLNMKSITSRRPSSPCGNIFTHNLQNIGDSSNPTISF